MGKTLKKLTALGLASCMVLAAAACGSSSGSSSASETTAAETSAAETTAETTAAETAAVSGEKVTVEFWHSMSGSNLEVLETMISKFNESQDEVEVVGTYQGSYYESIAKAVADIAVGNGPDIIQSGSGQVIILQQEDVTANLLDYMGEDTGVFIEDFVEGFYTDYYDEAAGKLHALPMGCSVPVLYVNTDVIEAAGVEVPKTWEEMAETSKYLVDNGYCDFGISQNRDVWYFWMMVETYGGPVFSEDGLSLECMENGTLYEAYDLLRDMVLEGTFVQAPATDSASTARGWLAAGDCAFMIGSIGSLNSVKTACEQTGAGFEVAQIPGHEINGEINYKVPYGGNTLIILDDSDKKDAAWKFIQWLYTDDNYGIAYYDYNTGYVACSETLKNTDLLVKKAEEDADWARAHEYLDTITTDYLIEAYGDLADDMAEFTDAVLYDGDDPRDAIAEQIDDVNDILAEHEGRP